METIDHANCVWLHFFNIPTYTKREKNTSECCTLLLTTAGIKPGPPMQQASALSITPLPLGPTQNEYENDFFMNWCWLELNPRAYMSLWSLLHEHVAILSLSPLFCSVLFKPVLSQAAQLGILFLHSIHQQRCTSLS